MSLRRRTRHAARPRCELLENRLAPATFTVTSNNNTGNGSLRQAVVDANAAAGADVIDFSSYFNVPRTITLASPISITDAVTIDGTSAANVTISGNNAVAIFQCGAAPSGTAIGFVDLTLTSGRGRQIASRGAAIFGDSQLLTVTRCVITNNRADTEGGAIYSGSPLTVTDSVFTGNWADASGGAIICNSLTATDSIFANNTSLLAGGAIAASGPTILTRCEISANTAYYHGGGLRTYNTLLLVASTVSGNLAHLTSQYDTGYGGGIFAGGATTVRNCTISGNEAGGGGGIATGIGTVTVQNSTITGNTFTDPSIGYGGGILGNVIELESSIVANGTTFGLNDIVATTVNARTSSIFNRSGITTFNDLGGNRPAGESPRLGPLQNNGGSTRTHALLPGSPCVDAGGNPANLTTDQRGPGFPRILNGAPDMGAFEGMDPVPTATPISIPGTIAVPGGTSFTVVVRYDDDIGIDLATIDLNDITVTGPGYAVPQTPTNLSIAGSGVLVTVTYTLPAPGGMFDFIDGGLYSVAMLATQVGDLDTPVQHFVAARPLGTFRVAIPGTLVVDEVTDIDDGNIATGHLSLREAIRLTNAAMETVDTITFDPAVFNTPRTVTMIGGRFVVNDPLTIVGPGAGLLTLDATGASGLFVNNVLYWGGPVNLSGLTLINGVDNIGNGGGIASTGRLTLSDITINNCQAYNGGGIYTTANLTLSGVFISNCTASNYGGGIYESGFNDGVAVALERCAIINNQAGASGGGLFIASNRLQISECTISGNQATTQIGSSGGGGLYFRGYGVNGSYIRNSTISGNVAANGSQGGGLNLYFYGTLAIANCTITGNSTTGRGGGIANLDLGGYFGQFGNLPLNSSIIAGNSSGSTADSGPDLYFNGLSPIDVSGNNNLLGVANSGYVALTGAGNLTGTLAAPLNPMLGPLANNSGPTKTHALLPGSPAINAGNNAAGLTTDQRGNGFVRVSGSAADIGAFELQPSIPMVQGVVINSGAAQRSRVTSLTVTFSTQATFAGAIGSAFTLTRNGGGTVNFSATASLVNGVTVVTLNAFAGSETEFGSLRDGRYTLTVLASQVSANGQQMMSNFTFGDVQGLYRFFGDVNGDRRLDIADFGLFSATYNRSLSDPAFNAIFDFNNDGRIDIADFGQFSVRFFTTLP